MLQSSERVAQVDHVTGGMLYVAAREAETGRITLDDCQVGFDLDRWPERDAWLRDWGDWEKLTGDGDRNR